MIAMFFLTICRIQSAMQLSMPSSSQYIEDKIAVLTNYLSKALMGYKYLLSHLTRKDSGTPGMSIVGSSVKINVVILSQSFTHAEYDLEY